MLSSETLFCVEIGGTNQRLAQVSLTDSSPKIVSFKKVSCSNPKDFLSECEAFAKFEFSRVGVATFGPVALSGPKRGLLRTDQNSSKLPWNHFNIVEELTKLFNKPVSVDTDVNCSALAEFLLPPHPTPLTSLAYITLGTGVGVGLIIHRKPVRGFQHPEGGHVFVPLLPEDQALPSACAKHDNCVEGRCAIGYLTQVIGCHQDELPQHQDHPVWARAAHYVATLAADIFLVASVETVVVGGGLASREGFVEQINREFLKLVENYIEIPVYKDLTTNEEIGSDEFPVVPFFDGKVIGIRSARVPDEDAAEVDESGNIGSNVPTVVNVIKAFNLFDSGFADQKAFMASWKVYIARITAHLKEAGDDAKLAAFKEGAMALTNLIKDNYKSFEFYSIASEFDHPAVVPAYWQNDSDTGAIFLYITEGIKQVKY